MDGGITIPPFFVDGLPIAGFSDLSPPVVLSWGGTTASAAAPPTAGPTLIYDTTSGVLSFDADGNGAGVAQVLATLSNHAALSASDFILARGGWRLC